MRPILGSIAALAVGCTGGGGPTPDDCVPCVPASVAEAPATDIVRLRPETVGGVRRVYERQYGWWLEREDGAQYEIVPCRDAVQPLCGSIRTFDLAIQPDGGRVVAAVANGDDLDLARYSMTGSLQQQFTSIQGGEAGGWFVEPVAARVRWSADGLVLLGRADAFPGFSGEDFTSAFGAQIFDHDGQPLDWASFEEVRWDWETGVPSHSMVLALDASGAPSAFVTQWGEGAPILARRLVEGVPLADLEAITLADGPGHLLLDAAVIDGELALLECVDGDVAWRGQGLDVPCAALRSWAVSGGELAVAAQGSNAWVALRVTATETTSASCPVPETAAIRFDETGVSAEWLEGAAVMAAPLCL